MSTKSPRPRRQTLLKLWLALALWCSLAYADASGEPARQAKQLVDSVEAVPENKKLAAEPLEKAKSALERAQNARASEDTAHAELLARLALEWAETARDLARAAELEKQASAVQKKTAKVEAKSVRAMAIVEAAVARRGRARERLEVLQAASSEGKSDTGASQGPSKSEEPKK